MTQHVPKIIFGGLDIKTICNGALGSMTFGAYHMFVTNKMMDQNNEIQRLAMEQNNEKQRLNLLEIEKKNDATVKALVEKVEKLEQTRKGWF